MPNPINIFRKGDARRLQVAEKAKNPKKNLSYENALASVDTLGESKGGRRKLRGLRRTGQLVDVKDARKKDRENRKKRKNMRANPKKVLESFRKTNEDRLDKVKKSYPNFSMGGPQEVDLPEATADTSNLYTGAFSNIKAKRYSKKNPGAKGISYKPSGGFRKRRKTTTYQDGQKADIVKRLGI